MWKLPRPVQDAGDVFSIAISKIADEDLKERLKSVAGTICEASDEFDNAASNNVIHEIEPTNGIDGIVTTKEMSTVYNRRMAAKGAPGRDIYDALMAAPKHGRCPLCGGQTVKTLDHYLPKAKYPALTVAPRNLVPACSDCNKAKSDARPLVPEEQALHPYYDDIEGEQWLFAEIEETTPPALRFFVDAPVSWDAVLRSRVLRQFEMLKLERFYATKAAQEMTDFYELIRTNYVGGGTEQVRELLKSIAESCRTANINGWRTATYSVLASSDWYCSGGFKLA